MILFAYNGLIMTMCGVSHWISEEKMIRIGTVNIDTSHPKTYNNILLKGERARYTAICNLGFRGREEVEGFKKLSGATEEYDTVEEMAKHVDVGFIHTVDWDKKLDYVEAFVKAGKPVFLDKPTAGNMKDVQRLRKLNAEGAMLLGSSCMQYCDEVTNFLAIPVEQRGEIVHVYTTVGNDEFDYAMHAVSLMKGFFNNAKPVSARMCGSGDVNGMHSETYFFTFEGGKTASFTTTFGKWQASYTTIMTNKGVYTIPAINTPAAYEKIMDLVCTSVETKERHTADIEDLIDVSLALFAGKISRENGGKEVKISDIPDDYEGFNGTEFAIGYSKRAGKLFIV